jgi:glycosyltransferase involved in cell wall biosynthesis
MKISQIHIALVHGDGLCSNILRISKIHKEIGDEDHIITEVISEYPDTITMGGNDYPKTDDNNLKSLIYKFGRFISINNKIEFLKLYRENKKRYVPGWAKQEIETSDLRIWHYGGYYDLMKQFKDNDILFYHGLSFSTLPINGKSFLNKNHYDRSCSYLKNNILKKNPNIITVSKNAKDELINFGFDPDKIWVLPLTHDYLLPYMKHDSSKINLLAYGRYTVNKRPDIIAEMANKEKINLILFGDNIQQLEYKYVYKQAKKWENENVKVYGKLKSIDDMFNNSNIYISNSNNEAFNIPIIESEAHSLPVLARKGSAMDELIIDGYNGYLFNDITEVPNLAKKILADYDKFSLNAYNESLKYTHEKFKENYLEIIHQIYSQKLNAQNKQEVK